MRMLLQIRAWLWYKRIDLFSVRLVSDELFTSALHIWFSGTCSFRSCVKRKTNLQHFYPSAEERCIGQKTKHRSKRTKKLAAASSKWVTTMKIPVVAVGSTTGFKNEMRKAVGLYRNRERLGQTVLVEGGLQACLCQFVCVQHSVLFIAQQLQLVLVFSEQSLESQVLTDDRQNLTQQISLPQTLKTNQRICLRIL